MTVFQDDLIIHSPSVPAHVSSLALIFTAYRRSNLRLNPRKCSMFTNSAEYLGHHVSPEGISPTKDYIEVVKTWPFPRTRTDLETGDSKISLLFKVCLGTALRQWIGKCSYYRKFIYNFSGIARPLMEKLSKDSGLKDNEEFPETPEMRKSFETLKQRLISAPILAYPDFDCLDHRPFILYTDWLAINNKINMQGRDVIIS